MFMNYQGLAHSDSELNQMIVETTDLNKIASLERAIPEFAEHYPLAKLETRLKGRDSLVLLALDGETAVGYKVGYAETPTRFYSWLGAVLPEHRGKGLARQMLHYQEQWCREQDFEEITVWSENRYRGMLVFLLKEGYDIFAVSGDGKILFRKML